jgi:hypothetical protein
MITEMNQGACAMTQTPCSGAEARGFEPRKGVNPNRISSPVSRLQPGGRRTRRGESAQVSGTVRRKGL